MVGKKSQHSLSGIKAQHSLSGKKVQHSLTGYKSPDQLGTQSPVQPGKITKHNSAWKLYKPDLVLGIQILSMAFHLSSTFSSGRGWLLCEFCKGQKTNVKTAESNRTYRRCPACISIGSVLCSNCKVFRCVTFPDHNDGESLSF